MALSLRNYYRHSWASTQLCQCRNYISYLLVPFVYFAGPPHEPGRNMLEKKIIATPTILGDTRAPPCLSGWGHCILMSISNFSSPVSCPTLLIHQYIIRDKVGGSLLQLEDKWHLWSQALKTRLRPCDTVFSAHLCTSVQPITLSDKKEK